LRAALSKLEEFHQVFGAYMQKTPAAHIPVEVFQGRVNLLDEELEEYREAYRSQDLVEIADALTDLLYVVLGTIVSHGLQGHAEALFAEVHRSNMSKLDSNGEARFRSDGKVIKSDRFSKPDLENILAEYLD
jgi:predicted HAD superfamily Cof-like phosphohydrolase